MSEILTVRPEAEGECCLNCRHWRQDPVYLEGECGMLRIVPTRELTPRPVLRRAPRGVQALVTDPTFGCVAWQQRGGHSVPTMEAP